MKVEREISSKTFLRKLKNYGTLKWRWYLCKFRAQYTLQNIGTGPEGHGNKWTRTDHPNDSIVAIGKNTLKNPEELRRLAVTQTPLEKPSANAGVKNNSKFNDLL